eukprot:1194608-Prorocentrum_minimum.AAC.1
MVCFPTINLEQKFGIDVVSPYCGPNCIEFDYTQAYLDARVPMLKFFNRVPSELSLTTGERQTFDACAVNNGAGLVLWGYELIPSVRIEFDLPKIGCLPFGNIDDFDLDFQPTYGGSPFVWTLKKPMCLGTIRQPASAAADSRAPLTFNATDLEDGDFFEDFQPTDASADDALANRRRNLLSAHDGQQAPSESAQPACTSRYLYVSYKDRYMCTSPEHCCSGKCRIAQGVFSNMFRCCSPAEVADPTVECFANMDRQLRGSMI